MKKNMSNADRLLRVLVAVVVAALYFTDTVTGLTGAILGIVAVVFLLTSLVGTCPLYMPFRFSTKKEEKSPA